MAVISTTLLVLIGVFLLAILLNMFYVYKESFVAVIPLNKDNVKKVLDDVILDLLSYYQKLQDSKSSDIRIKYRLGVLTTLLNQLNDNYPSLISTIQNNINFSALPSSFTLNDLDIIKNFLTYRVGVIASSDILAPADLTDLDLLSNRLQATFDFVVRKANLLQIPVDPNIGITVRTIRENLKNLKLDLPNVNPQDINLLKVDQYIPALVMGVTNFAIPPNLDTTPIPPLVISNLPSATSYITSLATPITEVISPPAPTPAPIPATTAAAPTPATSVASNSNLKFSELVQSLVSFSPLSGPRQQAVATPVVPASPSTNLTSTADDLLATPSDVVLTGSNVPSFFDKIRGIIREEVQGQMSNVAYTPKDAQSAKVASRSAEVVTCETPTTNSDALQQGSWFRQDQGCPYASSQVAAPFDMNEYIRKDSIPCYGCTLK